jgi:hypothetical protein
MLAKLEDCLWQRDTISIDEHEQCHNLTLLIMVYSEEKNSFIWCIKMVYCTIIQEVQHLQQAPIHICCIWSSLPNM